jgi:hypothetical protein
VAGVESEAGEDVGVGELPEAVFGAVKGAEEHLGELVGGEHAVLVNQAEDRAVAVGEAPGEAGDLVGQAPRARPRSRPGRAGGVGGQWCAPPSGVGALNVAVTAPLTWRLRMVEGAGSKLGGRVGARLACRPVDRGAEPPTEGVVQLVSFTWRSPFAPGSTLPLPW